MLRALNQQGQTVVAEACDVDESPFFCPGCQQQVLLKQGRIKIGHFAHLPASDCAYALESEAHRGAKWEIYQSLQAESEVADVRMEHSFSEVRADVSFLWKGQRVAIEVQASHLASDVLEERTLAYTRKNIAVLWTPLFREEIWLGNRYAPRRWEKYIHGLYYGKVYYWEAGLKLQPVKFEEYRLAPNWYSTGQRSKQFVTPVLLSPCSLLDLAPIWRKEWRSYPRAKLWCGN